VPAEWSGCGVCRPAASRAGASYLVPGPKTVESRYSLSALPPAILDSIGVRQRARVRKQAAGRPDRAEVIRIKTQYHACDFAPVRTFVCASSVGGTLQVTVDCPPNGAGYKEEAHERTYLSRRPHRRYFGGLVVLRPSVTPWSRTSHP
jgi:hypothetical protein